MGFVRTALIGLACSAPGGSAVLPPDISSVTIAMLDPTRNAAALCGGPNDALRDRLALAARMARGADAQTPADIPLFDGLPGITLALSTDDPLARRYFGQGLVLAYGFNHQAAIRSFRAAQAIDPGCALCFWGEALAHGPNINAPMAVEDRAPALAALARAQALADRAAPHERALIEALATRYSAADDADRAALDLAYADAMAAVAARFPDSDDIAVLAAEARMDTSPWNYWEADGRTPLGRVGEAIALIDAVIARAPRHVQAAQLQIHLMEASARAGMAEPAADRLARRLAPAAGHLVHMPAHIYFRLGRFADSIRVNAEAARADEAFLAAAGDSGLYRYGYYPHNVHFLVASAQMAGDMATALDQSARLATILDPAVGREIGWLQMIHAAPYLAHAQFADPETILAQPLPAGSTPLVAALRDYSRAVAHGLRGDRRRFDASLAAMARAGAAIDHEAFLAQGFPSRDLLELAETVAQGRRAMAAGEIGEAMARFTAAAAIEDRLPYLEPPLWYYPVRQSLGAALYRAGQFDDARAAFRAAIAAFPANGWALWGLAQTERALGHRAEAAAAEAAFRRAWLGDGDWLTMERL